MYTAAESFSLATYFSGPDSEKALAGQWVWGIWLWNFFRWQFPSGFEGISALGRWVAPKELLLHPPDAVMPGTLLLRR